MAPVDASKPCQVLQRAR